MKPVHFRSLVLGLVAIVAVPALAMAQAGSPILNSLEVQKLVASTDPADNARLSAHFAALAEQYAREAARHESMAQAFIGAPTRRTPSNSAADHCVQVPYVVRGACRNRRYAGHYS